MKYIHSEETLEVPDNGKFIHHVAPRLFRPSSLELRVRLRMWKDKRQKEVTKALTIALSTVKVHIKSRIITVEGPRGKHPANTIQSVTVPEVDFLRSGKLVKNMQHLAVGFSHTSKNIIAIDLHHGARKNVATLRTVKTIINNLIIGVTKGFKYKMRYVYAHFPINVNIEKNSETGLFEVEIRYVSALASLEKVVSNLGGSADCGLETSLARRLCAKSSCSLVWTSSLQNLRRMNCS